MQPLTWTERESGIEKAQAEMGAKSRAELCRRIGIDANRYNVARNRNVKSSDDLRILDNFLRRGGFAAREHAETYGTEPDTVEAALLVIAGKLETTAAALRIPGLDPHYKLREWRRALNGLVDLDEALIRTEATGSGSVERPKRTKHFRRGEIKHESPTTGKHG